MTVASNIEEALEALGVTDNTLTAEEKQRLDENGYVAFPGLMTAEMVHSLCERTDALLADEVGSTGNAALGERGTRRLFDLVNKGAAFDSIYIHPKVLAAVHHVLRRAFKLFSLNFRDALPGEGRQSFHADWLSTRQEGEPFHVVNSLWLLDDFTADNGATRVLPGSHTLCMRPAERLGDPEADHPDQRLIVEPAGTVVVFNGHLWHGGTLNRTSGSRRVIHCSYTGREHKQQWDQQEYIRKNTFDRISPAARYILDVR